MGRRCSEEVGNVVDVLAELVVYPRDWMASDGLSTQVSSKETARSNMKYNIGNCVQAVED